MDEMTLQAPFGDWALEDLDKTTAHGKVFRCQVCGKFIGYKEIHDLVDTEFIPDTPFTVEETLFTHKKCQK